MIEFSVRRPVAVTMICIGLIVLGIIAMKRIPMQLLPNIFNPEFTILTEFRGATPEEIETQITAPIERAVSTVPGLYHTNSVSEPERSEIHLSFKSNIEFLETVSVLRERLDGTGLPDGASRPKILRFQSNNSPVIRLAVKPADASLSFLELSRILQDTLVRKLESVDGVALANLMGAPEREINIVLDPIATMTYGLNLTAIPDLIQAKNRSFPAGDILFDGRRTSVKLGQSIDSLDQLKGIILKKDGERFIHLGDLASIETVVNKPRIRTHLNNEGSLVIELRKEADANSVEVAKASVQVIDKFLDENRAKIKGEVLLNQGEQIQTAIDNVRDTVIHGGMLAALVIFILLQSAWPTFVVSVSMPLSLLITLILMYFTGVTFNLMSLAGLALGVGMLVDNSTVVLDSIHKNQLTNPDRHAAAVWGAKGVAGAITASTLATMAVFGPLAFVEGMIGQMFRDVAATVCFSMLASLFVALIVIPMLSSIELAPSWSVGTKERRSILARLLEGYVPRFYQQAWYHSVHTFYQKIFQLLRLLLVVAGELLSQAGLKVLQVTARVGGGFFNKRIQPLLQTVAGWLYGLEDYLRRVIPAVIVDSRKTIRWAVVLTLLGVAVLMLKGGELFPDEATDRLVYELEFPPGQILDVTEEKVFKIEADVAKVFGIKNISSVIGEKGTHSARLMLTVLPKDSLVLAQQVSEKLNHVAALNFNRTKDAMIGEGKPVQVEVYNENLSELKEQAAKVKAIVSKIDGLVDIETDIKSDVSEVNIGFSKDRLSWYGVDASDFVSPLKAMLMGQNAGLLQIKADSLPVRVVVPSQFFNSLDRVKYWALNGDDEKRVYLNQVSDIKENKILGSIRRVNRKRMASISAGFYKSNLETISKNIRSALEKETKGTGINWKIGGQDEERARSQKSLLIAVGLSVFLIYLMLAGQFESLIQPAIILMAVPLCLSGVAVFLILFNLNISALVFVGMIILVGSSVNTSIVMVDFANQLVVEGKSIKEAITEATVRRMRPIIVTTSSNVFGHLPMALAIGQGAAMQQPLAVTLIGGLISSTALTVLIVPIIYGRLTKDSTRANSK